MSLPSFALHHSVTTRLRAAGCVYAEDEARILLAAAVDASALDALVAQRVAGRPLEHVVGWAEFCGLAISVGPGVFVPRRRTELLVRRAAAILARRRRPVVVDLCCGSGAVGAALLDQRPDIELHAADLDPVAVEWARRNLGIVGDVGGAHHGGHQVHQGDLFDALPPRLLGRVDVVLANAPYVPSDQVEVLPAEARVYESRLALDGGADGLDVQRRVVAGAPSWLRAGGHLLVETSLPQASSTAALFARSGLSARVLTSEELGATAVLGRRPSAP